MTSTASRGPRLAALAFVAAATLAGCGSGGTGSQPAAAGTQCTVAKGATSAQTHNYTIALGIGKVEKMYTRTQVERMKPKRGEVMLKGRMAMTGMSAGPGMAGMSSGSSAMAHLEVHICSRASGKTADVTPAITVIDRASGRRSAIPVATMEGIGEGHADLHYGNNVSLPHQAAVEVVVAGEKATLIPATG